MGKIELIVILSENCFNLERSIIYYLKGGEFHEKGKSVVRPNLVPDERSRCDSCQT